MCIASHSHCGLLFVSHVHVYSNTVIPCISWPVASSSNPYISWLPCVQYAQRVMHSVMFVCVCVCLCVCACVWPKKTFCLHTLQSIVSTNRVHTAHWAHPLYVAKFILDLLSCTLCYFPHFYLCNYQPWGFRVGGTLKHYGKEMSIGLYVHIRSVSRILIRRVLI